MKRKIISTLLLVVLIPCGLFAQEDKISKDELLGHEISDKYRPIQFAVPFLTIAPDSRAGSLGDAGVASTPDINSQHWNASKYAFMDSKAGVSVAYTPWLGNLVKGINLAYLVGYYKFDENQVLSSAMRYFSLGSIIFTDETGQELVPHMPFELGLDAGYTRRFSDHLSGNITFRFIYSNLSGGVTVGSTETKPAIAYAADVSSYYERPVELGDKSGEMGLGINLSNIGTKIGYSDENEKSFIPMNLRLGGRLSVDLDAYNEMSFMVDLNKLLIPTPPFQNKDTLIGEDPANMAVMTGMVRSFYDAPGGFKEEMSEIMYSVGVEYWYAGQFAARAGYFLEHKNKGNRKYLTVGVGIKYNIFSIDFAYLVPASGRNNPLANTIRFTLGFDLDKSNFD